MSRQYRDRKYRAAATSSLTRRADLLFYFVGTMASFVPHIHSGKIKVIWVLAEKRLATHPEIPTFVESGFPELTTASWQGVFVPTGTPRPIVDKHYTTLIKVMNDKGVIECFA